MSLNQEISLKKIKIEEKNILENLITLYLHDLSEFTNDLKIDSEGKFVYEGLDLYFTKEELYPYFIYLKDEIIGFVFINTGRFVPKDINYLIHELFILRSYRGKGYSVKAIEEVFKIHKGNFKVSQLANNSSAIFFWKKLYKLNNIEYLEKDEVIDDLNCFSQYFSIH